MANTINVQLQSLNKDMTFAAKGSSGHWIMIDTDEAIGGNGAGTKPLEMLLEALAGCTGMDVISILRKKRTPFKHLGIRVEGKKREEHPKSFTHIHMYLKLYSDGGEKALRDLQRAVDLSYEKYCTVSNMLKATAEITYDIEIVNE